MKFYFLFLFTSIFNLIFSQDTIRLIGNPQTSLYKEGGGISYVCDELMCNITIHNELKPGLFVLLDNYKVIGKLNYISSKEYLLYYYKGDDSIVSHIDYRPYFKISLSLVGSRYAINTFESYKKVALIEFNLLKEQCYIRLFDRRKKIEIEILDLEFIKRYVH